MDDLTTSQVLANSKWRALDNIKEYFALISAGAGITALLGSTVFLYAYLAVFDWRLIWVIEYSDVLKFGLVIFGIATGFLYAIQSYALNAYDAFFNEDPKQRIYWQKFVTVLFVGSLWYNLLYDETHEEHYYALHIWMHVSVLLIGGIVFWTVYRFRNWQSVTYSELAKDAILAIIILSIFGQTFGYYTRDMQGFKHDVILNWAEMKDVGVVMITSHHTVLATEKGDVIIVPSADVSQIVRRAPPK